MPRTYPKPRARVTPPVVTIRTFREFLGLSLEELAARIRAEGYQISKPGLGNIETGERGPSLDFLLAWQRAMDAIAKERGDGLGRVNETPTTVDRDARASARSAA